MCQDIPDSTKHFLKTYCRICSFANVAHIHWGIDQFPVHMSHCLNSARMELNNHFHKSDLCILIQNNKIKPI